MKRWLVAVLLTSLIAVGAASVLAQAHYRALQMSANTSCGACAPTVAKSGTGIFYGIVINTKGAGGNYLSVYDNTAAGGTYLGIIDTTVTIGTLVYNVIVTNGVAVTMSGGTAANVTVLTD